MITTFTLITFYNIIPYTLHEMRPHPSWNDPR